MKRSLLFSCVALATFIAVSVAGADVAPRLKDAANAGREAQKKAAVPHRAGRSIDARSYRSPSGLSKITVAADDAETLARAQASGATEVADYGSFRLLAIPQPALAAAEPGRLTVRDDFNVLFLRSGAIDTTAADAPGTYFGMGRAARFARRKSASASGEKSGRLRLVQFAGPVKSAWLDNLRAAGFEPIAYLPSNAYLVRGDAGAAERLMRRVESSYARGEGFIQWEGPFLAEHKLHPALVVAAQEQPDAEITVAVQVARGAARADADVDATMKLASALLGSPYPVLGFTNLKMRVSASRIAEIAALENVVNVEPWTPPQLFDERASQIVAGELDPEGKQARGPGYMAWLQARGFATPFNFAIDVTDTGMDRGSIEAGNLHPDFLDASGQSRVVYARDYTSELDPGDTQGHGTINLSIAGGGSAAAGENLRDADGYNHGLGVAPFARLGSSKIFKFAGRFDLVEPYTRLISEAYANGARISSNSWGAGTNDYTLDALEYDTLARDADPRQPGNQEMVICFSAGNAGPGGRIGSPGTGKNVISVAAGENFRKGGADGCGAEDEDADSALDIAFFSSGGNLSDGRVKPDIAAPGTHVQGAASQHPDFDGSGVCGLEFIDKPYFPENQTLYTWSSGTSHSTPMVAGAAALARQFFLNRGEEPSAALIKALLLNTTTYMTGANAGGDLPHPRQGWGLMNLGRAFNNVAKIFINQTHTFGDSGQEFFFTGEIESASEPFRVTLAWSDAPGLSSFAPWVNNLDLEVVVGGQVYRGNHFKGQTSAPGGEPNTRDNVEGVWLPAGVAGTFAVRVRATNVAGDGVPGNTDLTDQDFALVVYNGRRKEAAVATLASVNLSGGTDNAADPGESVSMRLALGNASPVALNGATGTLTTT
ncbi:MAG TPA: S8 family serine peptidase, partial [Blastocatellia bacterium]|nr:S8 family serine peptidase [Blastocatellia bacterium]